MSLHAEDGFTLPELLVSIVILGAIIGALTSATITGLKVTDETSARVKESTDAQLASAYFASDVASSNTVSAGAHAACTLPADASAVVSFEWKDAADPLVPRIATWFTRDLQGERHLARRACDGASGSSTTVSRALASAGPELTCAGGCGGGPRRVELLVTELSGYTFRLAGTRRSAP